MFFKIFIKNYYTSSIKQLFLNNTNTKYNIKQYNNSYKNHELFLTILPKIKKNKIYILEITCNLKQKRKNLKMFPEVFSFFCRFAIFIYIAEIMFISFSFSFSLNGTLSIFCQLHRRKHPASIRFYSKGTNKPLRLLYRIPPRKQSA